MNRVSFIGNVGNEPTTTVLESGTVVMNFDIATSESFNDRNGQPQVKTEWHRIVAWNDCAKKIQEHLHKGNCVTIKAKAHFLDVLKWARVLSGITAGVPCIFYHRNKYRATHLIMNQRL